MDLLGIDKRQTFGEPLTGLHEVDLSITVRRQFRTMALYMTHEELHRALKVKNSHKLECLVLNLLLQQTAESDASKSIYRVGLTRT